MRRSTLATEIAKLKARMSRPRFLRIKATILVHEHRKPEHGQGVCECCGFKSAVIAADGVIPAADLIIDLATGDRHTAESCQGKAGAWEALCGVATLHDLKIRCTRPQLELLNDETGRHLVASSGNRSGKSTTSLSWIVLQWLRRGGRGQRFWLIASTEKKAYRLLEKLIKPNKKTPPLLPPTLVQRAPDSHRASNLLTTLVDGSIIDLIPFKNDPEAERGKSDPIVAGLVDEAAHLPTIDWLVALRGRCLDDGGRLCFATTARPNHFLKTKVVDKYNEFEALPADDPKKISGDHEGAAWKVVNLTIPDNPWLDPEKVAMDMKTLDFTRPEVMRDWLGLWVASEGKLWEARFIPDIHVVTTSTNDIESAAGRKVIAEHAPGGQVPITKEVVKMLFGRKNPHLRGVLKATNEKYILGSDVNIGLMNSAVIQVTAQAGDEGDREKWHYWIIDIIQTPRRHQLTHPERIVSIELAKQWDHGVGSPFKGCGVIADGKTMVNAGPSIGKQAGTLPEWYATAGLDCRAPIYRDSERGPIPNAPITKNNFKLIQDLLRPTESAPHGRLHVFQDAAPLLRAFDEQLDSGDGTVPVDARSGKWDVMMGPIDAMRYGIYAIANARKQSTMVAR